MSDTQDTGTTSPTTEAPLQSGQFFTNDGIEAAMKPNEAELGADTAPEQDPAAEALKAAEAAKADEATKAIEAQKAEEAKFAAKFAALSRKEKQLRAREREIEQRLRAIEEQSKAKEAELTSKLVDPARLKREPLKVLEETGLTFQQLAEMVLNEGKPTAEMLISEKEKAFDAKIKAVEAKLEAKEKAEAEARLQAQIDGFKAQIKTSIANNATEYELINANQAYDLVYEVIEAHHARTAAESDDGQGEILDTDTAARAVEEHLLAEAKKVLGLSKIKGMLQPEASKQPAADKAQPASATTGTKPSAAKTLTNAASVAAQSSKRKLSEDESKAEAAKLLKWID